MGHDGSKPAKSAAVNITAMLLKQPGYFVEVSGVLKDILQAKGAPIVTDEEVIRKVLKGKEIELNDDGSYQREIGGKVFTKMLMGETKSLKRKYIKYLEARKLLLIFTTLIRNKSYGHEEAFRDSNRII
jgi:hypothetical protein